MRNYKNLIDKHISDYLSEAKVNGVVQTDKVQKEEGKFNKEYYKDVKNKMGEYDDAAKKKGKDAIDPVKNEYSSEEEEYHDQMEIRNGMEMLKYDNEPDERFKERQEMALAGDSKMGNKTYTGDENGNTEEVWGSSGGKNTGEEIVKAVKASAKKRNDAEYNLVQFGEDIENSGDKKTRGKARKVAVENKANNDKPLNETKMEKKKRLRFKKPFDGLGNALQLIPENYKKDGKEFEMTDGNESYGIRWEGSLNEGRAVVLKASDSNMVNEDIQHMKHLMGFKSEETLGTLKGQARIDESTNNSFRAMLDKTRGLMTEANENEGEVLTEGLSAAQSKEMDTDKDGDIDAKDLANLRNENEEVNEMENIDGQKAPVEPKAWSDADGPEGDNYAELVMKEEDEVTESEEVTENEEMNESFINEFSALCEKYGINESEMEEGIGSFLKKAAGKIGSISKPSKEMFAKSLEDKAFTAKRLGMSVSDEQKAQIMAAAEKDYFGGTLQVKKGQGLIYVPSGQKTGERMGSLSA